MKKKDKYILNINQIILTYIFQNSKKYILMIVIFLIGIFGGVILSNNISEETAMQISNYIISFIDKFKTANNINFGNLIIVSIKRNVIIALILWFAGTTVIGIPIVFILVFFRGLSLGYTISSITYTLGISKGIVFSIITLFLQNIIFIPAILTIGVSSIKLYKSILKDRKKENIRLEILKHTIISIAMMGFLIISSFIENGVCFNVLQKLIKYF